MSADEHGQFEWQEIELLLPRIGKMVTRDGIETKIIWPGMYLVRRSRTVGGKIYRRPGSVP